MPPEAQKRAVGGPLPTHPREKSRISPSEQQGYLVFALCPVCHKPAGRGHSNPSLLFYRFFFIEKPGCKVIATLKPTQSVARSQCGVGAADFTFGKDAGGS